jgi:hypothetical protein
LQKGMGSFLLIRYRDDRNLAGRSNYTENGLVKPPRSDTRGLSPPDIFEGKAPLRVAAQKSRPHAP